MPVPMNLPLRARRPLTTLVALAAATLGATSFATAQADRLAPIAAAIVTHAAPAQDDPDQLALTLLTAAEQLASSPAASRPVELASDLIEELRRPAEMLPSLRAVLAAKPHGLVEQAVHRAEFRLLRWLDRYEEALDCGYTEGYARAILVVGPLGDPSIDSTNVPLDPELLFPAPGTVLTDRYGRPTQPRTVAGERHRRSLALRDDRLGKNASGVYYALHQVQVNAPTSCYAEIDANGSVEVFVDGVRVFLDFAPASRTGPARRYVSLRLAAGTRHVLIKSSDTRANTLQLRYVDSAGRTVAGVQELSADRIHPTTRGDGALPPALGAMIRAPEALDRAAHAAGDTPVGRSLAVAAALTGLADGRRDLGEAWLVRLRDVTPAEAELRAALASAFDRSRELPSEIRNGLVRSLVESAAEELGDHHYAEVMTARLLVEEERSEDAVRLLQARLERHPTESSTFAILETTLRDLGFRAHLTELWLQWREAVPTDLRPLLNLVNEERYSDPKLALSHLLEALQSRPGSTVLRRRAVDIAAPLGERALCAELNAWLQRDDPESVEARVAKSAIQRDAGDVAGAVALDAAVAVDAAATVDQALEAAGRLALAGATDQARAAYAAVAARAPEQHAARRIARTLAAEAPLPHFARFRHDADAVIAAFEPGELEKTSSVTTVLDHRIVQVLPDGSQITETHIINRANDLRGVEILKDASSAARADEVLRVRTVTPSGASFVPNRVQGTYSMTRLEPGAFVELWTRSRRTAPDAGPWRIADFVFQSSAEPLRLSEFVVILPPEHPGTFRIRRFGDGVRETVDLGDGNTAHVFRHTDQPRLETEPLTPSTEDLVPIVTYGEDELLSVKTRSAYARAVSRATPSAWVAATTASILQDVQGDTAKVHALYDWLQANIQDAERGSADPTEILERRRGSRFYLFAAMLEAAEVPFDHLLAAAALDAMSNASEPLFHGDPYLPVPTIRIRPRDAAPGATPIWMFSDHPHYMPLGELPPERRGATAVLLGLGTHEVLEVPGGNREADMGWRFAADVTLREDGGAQIEMTGDKRGDMGFIYAAQLRHLPADQRSLVARQIASQFIPDWTIEKSGLEGLDPGERLFVRVAGDRRGFVQTAGEDRIIELPMSAYELVGSLAPRAERTLPMVVTSLDFSAWRVTVDPGPALRFAAMPKSLDLRHRLLDYALHFSRDGDKLVIERSLRQRPGRLEPADYPAWRRMLQQIDAAEAMGLKLRER